MFGVIGINFNSAPLAVRDKISFTDSGKMEFMRKAQEVCPVQLMVLSTCNRCEVYFFGEDKENKIEELFLNTFGSAARAYISGRYGEEALSYLFRVTAGLESMALGEDQILAQVRESWELSRAVGCSGKELNRIILSALTCAKKIKTRFRISEVPLSVSYIGIRLLQEKCGIDNKNVLVIGSGKTAALSIRYLREYENVNITACSRNFTHAENLRNEFPKVKVVPFSERYSAMENADIVLSATSAPHFVVKADKLSIGKKLTFLDLASPRDIDPAISEMADKEIIDLDSLELISRENMELRKELCEKSQTVIDESVTETVKWLSSTAVDDAIKSLQELCQEITEDSFSYLQRKMSLSNHDQRILKKVISASLLRLIREPIRELKSSDKEEQQEYSKILTKLFGFDQEGTI